MTSVIPKKKVLSKKDRGTLRKILREEARKLGYGPNGYHSYRGQPLGPQDWPQELRALNRMLEFLSEDNWEESSF
jgi:hypothetical protein